MNGRIEAIIESLEPLRRFDLAVAMGKVMARQMQRQATEGMNGLVTSGVLGPASWVALGLRRLAAMGEARRAT